MPERASLASTPLAFACHMYPVDTEWPRTRLLLQCLRPTPKANRVNRSLEFTDMRLLKDLGELGRALSTGTSQTSWRISVCT